MTVIAAARDNELADHRIAADVAFTLEQDGLLHRLRLGPLRRVELEELARRRSDRDTVPAALGEWLEAHSRGNALYATGLLGALLDQGAALDEPALAAIPDELGQRVRALMRNLDDDCVQTLDLLAVLGSRAELNDLTRLAGRPGDAVAVALDRLVRRRLVREDPSGPPPSRSRTRSCRT